MPAVRSLSSGEDIGTTVLGGRVVWVSWEPSWHRSRPERSLDSMELKEKQDQEEVHFN